MKYLTGFSLLVHNNRAKLPSMNADALIFAADSALRTLFATPRAARPTPKATARLIPQQDGALAAQESTPELTEAEKSLSAALMRVNHVGEVCAQALYLSQGLLARTESTAQLMEQIGRAHV